LVGAAARPSFTSLRAFEVRGHSNVTILEMLPLIDRDMEAMKATTRVNMTRKTTVEKDKCRI
jgi:hypothetical protein